MCDHEHYSSLASRVDALEDSVAVYHARTDERLKTLFNTCDKLSGTARSLMISSVSLLGIVLLVTVFALVYGAVGPHGFNAVTHAAQESAMRK